MKKFLFWSLTFIALVFLIINFASTPINNLIKNQSRAGIKITSTPSSEVFLNGQSVGKTPYQNDDLTAGDVSVKLVSDSGNWQGKVTLSFGTVTAVNRDLSSDPASSSGEVMALIAGTGVVITSNPSGSDVKIDDKSYGVTPLSIPDLSPGEHRFLISKENHLQRSVMAILPDHLSLHLSVDLAISEAKQLDVVTPTPLQQLLVKQNQLGFLRVRAEPSLLSSEVGRVIPGDKLSLVEDQGSWLKVKLTNGAEGYVASSYVEKQ